MSGVQFRGAALFAAVLAAATAGVRGQDWPQWRGPNRDAKAAGFKAPKAWPKELTRKWSVTVGDGVATPALVGDKLYVFSRQGGDEILRCLEAETGKEVWAQKWPATAVGGPARGFPGPRASPAVGSGKVVALGVQGSLACFDADTGKPAWKKDDFKGSVPGFATSSSPVILGDLVVAQLGSGRKGVIAAYELATGKERWKASVDGTAYGSPSVLPVGDGKAVVALTGGSVVAVDAAEGKPLWKADFKTRYNATTPVVEGDTVLTSGKGVAAVKLEKAGTEVKAKELWTNRDNSLIYNSPAVADGHVYGISERNQLFCIDLKSGKTAWTAAAGGRGGYGSVVAAGPVMLALTTAGELRVFEPDAKAYKELAKYPVGKETYAYPVASGNRVFIKDKDTVALWVVPE